MTIAREERTRTKGKPLILQLDAAGNPSRWINFEQAAFYYAKDLIAWSMGGEDTRIFGGTNRQGSRSFLDLNTIIAVRGELGDKAMFRTPTLTNRALFRRDQSTCAYCGEEFAPSRLSRDHVVPRSKNGQDIWTNVVTACCSCNKRKDARTPEQANMGLLYVPYAPNRSEYLILMNRTILTDQMDFLKARVTKNSRILSPIKV